MTSVNVLCVGSRGKRATCDGAIVAPFEQNAHPVPTRTFFVNLGRGALLAFVACAPFPTVNEGVLD